MFDSVRLVEAKVSQQAVVATDVQVNLKLEVDDQPTREEIRKATMQLKVGKSPGIDAIPA